MDMSLDYMQETVEFLGTKGFETTSTKEQVDVEGQEVAQVHTFTVTKGEQISFVLETWCYPTKEKYYLEITRYHQLTSTSFPLDSWKHKPHQVEFKYYVLDQESMGLSFILSVEES